MKPKLKIWLALAFLVVFLAGGTVGLFFGAFHARRHFMHRHDRFTGERMRRHLERELALTPAQAAQVDPIITRTAAQLDAVRRETGERVRATMRQAHEEIAPLLTPAQRERLEGMRQRHLRALGRHHPGSPMAEDL